MDISDETMGPLVRLAMKVRQVHADGGMVLDTSELLEIAKNDGNRALDRAYVAEHADPDGLHLAFVETMHGDGEEYRLRVLIKTDGEQEPTICECDVTPAQYGYLRDSTERFADRLDETFLREVAKRASAL